MGNKRKVNKEDFKKFISDPKGKAFVFFVGYLIFFIVIGIVARVGGSNNYNRDYETETKKQFDLTYIERNNYKFNYKIKIDDNYLTYSGIRYDTQEKVTCTNLVEYYGENGNYFVNNSGLWIKADNPYKYSEFYDINNIYKLLEMATYISKTTYESGKDVYNFSISSSTINKMFENVDIDVEELPNEIIVSTDYNGNVNEIKFTLDSYCKVKNICVNNMSITLAYELYGEIEKITSPLE